MWNTGGLRADLGLVRDGGWDRLDDEKRKERQASKRNIEWLRTHVTLSEPTVVFLEEVTGSLGDAKIGLRRTFTRLGYATLMLPGEGGGAGKARALSSVGPTASSRRCAGTVRLSSAARGGLRRGAWECRSSTRWKWARQSGTTSACTGFTRSPRRRSANDLSRSSAELDGLVGAARRGTAAGRL